jgi:exodeoxyribonuclease V beta subunit
VNTIFSNTKSPFVFDKIIFDQTEPAKNSTAKPGIQYSRQKAKLKLWHLKSRDEKPLKKSHAVNLIANAVAGEIARITSHADQPFQSGDIAVLVRTNKQAEIIKDALSNRSIPSVLYNAGNVFDSDEAKEMERILAAIAEPGNERKLKSALVTRILGVSARELDEMGNNTRVLETWMAGFKEYFKVWNKYGFIRMLRLFITQEGVKKRILALKDGERRLTNILQLIELIHKRSEEKNGGITGLIKWLSEQRDPSIPTIEEHQLRLESDELAIKIITIHKSKGLEFPVVFCPFCWESSLSKDKEVIFHDSNQSLTLDIGSKDLLNHTALAQNELLAENVRLLYVALTRAKELCYLVWGRINKADTSAMAYLLHDLFHDENVTQTDHIVAELKKRFNRLAHDDFLADLRRMADRSNGSIEICRMPEEHHLNYKVASEKNAHLFYRKFAGKIDRNWKVTSYSSLVSGQLPDDELPDHDAVNITQPRQTVNFIDFQSDSRQFERAHSPGNDDIFSFPKGAKAGIFFHDLLEKLDFKEDVDKIRTSLVKAKLEEYGFDLKWNQTVCAMINNLISTPLLTDNNDLILSSVANADRISEMEFYFPLKTVTVQKLCKIFSDYGGIHIPADFPSRLEKLNFMPSEGFMKGYIDLIFRLNGKFYLVDWKSNFLGSQIEDYSKENIGQTMNKDLYILQYHIYLLATHQYLRRHIPQYEYESEFGGVFYIFLRGIDQSRGPKFGVYHDLPSPELIDALGKELIYHF